MITAHLPSGYVLGITLKLLNPWAFPAALAGGVFPDLDLIWFYFVDDRAFHHHRYWVHAPAFWLIVAAVGLPLIWATWRKAFVPATVFIAAVLLHICFDAIASGIVWLWPYRSDLFSLITVPATYDNWVLNFVLHPVFLLEIAIWIVAVGLCVRRPA